jgi:hypothetical protein
MTLRPLTPERIRAIVDDLFLPLVAVNMAAASTVAASTVAASTVAASTVAASTVAADRPVRS